MRTKNLSGDIFGGVTAAIVALPLALAFGVQSGLGAIAGLYGAIVLGIIAALFGGTKTQISGPTGPMVVVAASVVSGQIAYYGSLDAAYGAIIATFILAGALQIIMGLSKIGSYIRYMPYPVVSGFMSGIGVIIIILQIFPFFGLNAPKTIPEILGGLGTIAASFNAQAVLLALSTIAIIYLFPRLTKAVPSTLVALVVLTVLSVALGLQVPIIGDIPEGLPALQVQHLIHIDWSEIMVILIPAITLAALGAIDSLLTSVVADNMTKTQHQSNKELIGQGLGNMAAGAIGGLPGAGATMRTVVNIRAGGNTQLSGTIHGVALFIVLLGAGAYAKLIPIPVLAGILITVGIGIIDYRSIKHIHKIPKADAVIMLIVLLITVLVDLLQAVAVGMIMATIWFMKQMSDTAQTNAIGSLPDDAQELFRLPDEQKLCPELKKVLYIQHFDGPFFFGFTAHFTQIMRELPNVSYVLFRFGNVPHIDQSGMYAIEDAVMELQQQGKTVLFCTLRTQPDDMLRKIQLIPGLVPEENVFKDFESAVGALKKRIEPCNEENI